MLQLVLSSSPGRGDLFGVVSVYRHDTAQSGVCVEHALLCSSWARCFFRPCRLSGVTLVFSHWSPACALRAASGSWDELRHVWPTSTCWLKIVPQSHIKNYREGHSGNSIPSRVFGSKVSRIYIEIKFQWRLSLLALSPSSLAQPHPGLMVLSAVFCSGSPFT